MMTSAGISSRPGTSSEEIAAALKGVSKNFGSAWALRKVTLEVAAGTVHALVGENGAGKSTALGILGGRISPSRGKVELRGHDLPHGKPRAARERGLAVIYQELTVVPELDAAANVFLGHPLSRQGFLSVGRMRDAYASLCERVGVTAHPAGLAAGSLSVADQQVLEILRALAFDAEVILFDEPTASLGLSERRALLALMKQLRSEGKTMVFVSHNLDEVMDVADAITVFRDGRRVASAERADWTKARLVDSMLGGGEDPDITRSLTDGLLGGNLVAPTRVSAPTAGDPVLAVEGLTVPGAVRDIGLSLRAGHIIGLGGLVGSGRTSVLRALAGLSSDASGELRIDGREVPIPRSVRDARKHGIALLPEDRKGQGLALEMSAAMNIVLPDLRAVSSFGVIREQQARLLAADAAEGFGFDRDRIAEPAGKLSGGNQQKLLLARWAYCKPRVLLVDEPTRGIDVGAKEEVLRGLQQMAGEGMAILLVSSELEEVAMVSSRVVVLAEGEQVDYLEAGGSGIRVSDILKGVFNKRPTSLPGAPGSVAGN